ncbi:MAG: cytochrome c oxidase assembly protein [Proteobacteria bacterium]|nr:MAG: cytochrome c oxidase assembly protein [Pseudomonadota bacterium]
MFDSVGNTLKALLAIAVLMVGFGFVLVPLYDVVCDITGLNGKTGVTTTAEVEKNQQAVDSNRTVTVQFDGNVKSDLPWAFHPTEFSMEVQLGQLYHTEYYAKNTAAVEIIGQAVPSVAPARASKYFNKTECFCFTEQLLKAGEEMQMPLTFIISRDLPENVKLVTLSYTFFNKYQVVDSTASDTINPHNNS